jgi:hypothetical protein
MIAKRVTLVRVLLLLLLNVGLAPGSVIAQADGQPAKMFKPTQSNITFTYPADWVAVEVWEGQAVLATNDPIRLESEDNYSSGQVRVAIFPPQDIVQDTTSTNPTDVLQTYVDAAGMSEGLIGEPTDITIGDKAAASVKREDTVTNTVIIALEGESGQYSFILVTTLPEDLETLLPSAFEIIETLTVFDGVYDEIAVEIDHLTKTFSTDDRLFSFRYPDDWSAEGDDSNFIPIIGRASDTEAETQAFAFFYPIPFGTVNLTQGLRDGLESNLKLGPGIIDRAERTHFILNGRSAVLVEAQDMTVSIVSVSVLAGDGVVMGIFATTQGGELERLHDDVLAITATFEYHQPEFEPISAERTADLTEEFTSANGTTRLYYPAGWIVEDRESLIFISNAPISDFGVAEPGQVVLVLVPSPYRAYRGIRKNPTPMDILYRIQPAIGFPVGVPAYTSFNDALAARVDVVSPTLEGMIFAFEIDSEMVLSFTMYANPGDLAAYEATLLAIVSTATHSGN